MSTTTLTRAPFQTIAASIWTAGAFCAGVLTDMNRAIALSHEVQRLSALSDARLARQGLRRDQIVSHVTSSMSA